VIAVFDLHLCCGISENPRQELAHPHRSEQQIAIPVISWVGRFAKLLSSDISHVKTEMLKAGRASLFLIPFGVALVALASHAQSSAGPTTTAPVKMTESTFKNIQILKAVPADQLIPAMEFITASLGVECEFCHVLNAFEKDDKKPKQTARKMMQMMFAINQTNFDGRREVTCYSCHRGSRRPLITPLVANEAPRPPEDQETQEHEANRPDLASADQLIMKYIQALGGTKAIEETSGWVGKGTITFAGRRLPIEVFAKAPDKRLSVVHLANGVSITAYNGREGWLFTPNHPIHEMAGSELDAARLDADLHFPLDIKQIFSDLAVNRLEKIGGREVYLMSGIRPGQPPVKFYFDSESGLLLRQVRYSQSPVGDNPTQIDYQDYRDSAGIKTAFHWTIARPGGQFTVQLDQVQHNVLVDDAKFTKPGSGVESPSP
jgi:photosynthetic reaction center cytochrome c subunit